METEYSSPHSQKKQSLLQEFSECLLHHKDKYGDETKKRHFCRHGEEFWNKNYEIT
jgi:hypothetical protein